MIAAPDSARPRPQRHSRPPQGAGSIQATTDFDHQTRLESPDTGLTQSRYDPAGNLIEKTDARGEKATYSYDAQNRVTAIVYRDETLGFQYDQPAGGEGAIGHLTQVTDGSGNTRYSYDRQGRVTAKSQTLSNGTTLAVEYSHDAQGRLAAMRMPSGIEIGYSYRADGRVVSLTANGVTLLSQIDYFVFGEPSGWTQGNGQRYVRNYDQDGRVREHTTGATSRTLGYDLAGRITALDDGDGGQSWAYGYDDLDRLEQARNSGSRLAITQDWTYDPTGNRTRQTTDRPSLLATTQGEGAYSVDPQSNRISRIGAQARSYDAVGNLAGDGRFTHSYSARNRLTRLSATGLTADYAYNAFGERVSKLTDRLVQFLYDEEGHLIGEYDQEGKLIAEHLWLEDTPVAVVKPAGGTGLPVGTAEVYFVHPDHLDTPRVIVDGRNQVVWRWDSTPFGETAAQEELSGTRFGYNLRFPGQYFDAESGGHYNYFRDYEPGTGRYRESDPIGLEGGINSYQYVSSNPIESIDVLGQSGLCSKRLQKLGLCNKTKLPSSRLPSAEIPKGGGVYMIFDCKGQLLYVGKAASFKGRMKGHRRDEGGMVRAFDNPCCPVSVKYLSMSMSRANKIETWLIGKERPPGNTQHNPNPIGYQRPNCKCSKSGG